MITNSLTHSMQQSRSWEANWYSASQEIPCILWNPKVRYRIQKRRPPEPILSQLDPFHTPIFYFLNIHLNIIFPSTPGSPKWPISLRFPHQNPVYACPHPVRATCPAHLILLDFITRTILGEQYRSLSPLLNSFLQSPCYLVPLRPKQSPQHPILKHPKPRFLPQCKRPSFNLYKTRGKIMVLYILIFIF